MTRSAVSVLLVCSSISLGSSADRKSRVVLIPHFEKRLGRQYLEWIERSLGEIFDPAGLTLEWYETREAAPAGAARVVDVWFRGQCRPSNARNLWCGPVDPERLGWVQATEGRIGDEVTVDCSAVLCFASTARRGTDNGELVTTVFLRLLERVLAHEFLHVLLNAEEHGNSELTAPGIYVSEWRWVGRLTPLERDRLRQLYAPGAAVARSGAP